MRFTIEGPPRTKKNHQQIRRTRAGQPFIAQADTASAWEEMAIIQLRQQNRDAVTRRPAEPTTTAVNMRALVYRDRNTGDLLNYLAAVSDALERAGVVENDVLIEAVDGSRLLIDRARPRVEIELTDLRGMA